MTTVTLSSKYQVVIPVDIREQAGLKPGTRFGIMALGNTIRMVPIVPIESLRGTAKGIDAAIQRDEDRF
ncbi:MAG: AbrB/MazE/SpoVT family DNA-binding domain-containing protein [Treponema sp.]|jgi:AbrB family looped-hinge helix DNA binding protein|nr:AbrB/MazE/SpoVT family DNA-binding domain-containing protein [Treponema sp.]